MVLFMVVACIVILLRVLLQGIRKKQAKTETCASG